MKTGLVLEGGGVRGIYTAGVLDTFMKYGITFDGLIGVSAGAIHGCSFLSSQRGRSIDYYMKYYNEPKFMSFKNWLRTGDVVDEEFAYHELPEKLVPYDNEAFLKNETPFYAVCTNVVSGLAEYIRINDMFADIDILRASASLPYFSRLVEFNGNKYLDGGCADSIPLGAFQNMGYERNVVILTRPADYVKSKENTAFAKLKYRKYPEFIKTLKRRHENYNGSLKLIEKGVRDGSVFLIRPSEPPKAGRMEHNPENIKATYELGVKDAENAINALIEWLK
jgi:predicted patatin/cPLA2 family phospholipase